MASQLDELFVDFGYRADTSGLDKADNRLSQTLKKVGGIARRVTAIMGGALLTLGGISVRQAATFEDAMAKSLAIMDNVSDANRSRMEQTARQVAKDTKFSAEEAAEAYFFLASAGMSAEQAIAALPQVAQFAQAGNFDLARATDLLTDAQSALGLSVDDTNQNLVNQTRLSDVLVKANTLANATVEQFSTSLTQQFGGALKAYNKDVEEGVAVLAAYADKGKKGAEAGTRLTAVTLDLVDVARKNEKEFKKHNVAIFDNEGRLRHYADIIADFEAALGGVSAKQQTVILGELGIQKEAQATLLELLGSSDAIREYEAGLKDAGMTTERVSEEQLKSFNAQLSLLKSVINDAAIGLGNKLLPHLTDLVRYLRDNSEQLIQVAGLLAVLAVAATLASLAIVVLGAAANFVTVVGGLAKLTGALAKIFWWLFVRLPLAIVKTAVRLTVRLVGAVVKASIAFTTRLIVAIARTVTALTVTLINAIWRAVAGLTVDLVNANRTGARSFRRTLIPAIRDAATAARVTMVSAIGAMKAAMVGAGGTLAAFVAPFAALLTILGAIAAMAGVMGGVVAVFGKDSGNNAAGRWARDNLGEAFPGLFAGGVEGDPRSRYNVFQPRRAGADDNEDVVTSALLGFISGPLPPRAGAYVGGSVSTTRTVTMGDIHVHTAATDSTGIARDIRAAVRQELETDIDDLTRASDSDILR